MDAIEFANREFEITMRLLSQTQDIPTFQYIRDMLFIMEKQNMEIESLKYQVKNLEEQSKKRWYSFLFT